MTAVRISTFLVIVTLWMSTPGGAQQDMVLWDLAAARKTSLQEIIPRLLDQNLVLVGEHHDNSDHHAAQLRVIQSLRDSGKPVAVALEMFERRHQAILDRWVSGEMDEAVFVPHFESNWGRNWPLYREIFLFCRDSRIPMVGINVPREITSQVARRGFASLSPTQRDILPMVSCRVDSEYLKLMREAHGHQGGDEAFTRFCEAQMVWDTAMAAYSLQYLQKHPGSTLVLLAGAVHAWRRGIPSKAREQDPGIRMTIFLPDSPDRFGKSGVSLEDADYLILSHSQ